MFGAHVSPKASLNRLAVIGYTWNFSIGDYSSIGPGCRVYAMNKITIADKSCIGKDVKLLTGSRSISDNIFSLQTSPISIGSCCWVATSSIVLPGVNLEDGVVIGAGAVVSKSVNSWCVVAGNPDKFIKNRVMQGDVR